MELMDVYNQIKNPLDDPKVIEQLINAYSNSVYSFGGFYGRLTKCAKKNGKPGQYYIGDVDKFYSMLFNKWKNSIVNLTKSEYELRYKNRDSNNEFIKMRNYLKNVRDVSTRKEADNILNGVHNDKELENALRKYSWEECGRYSGWIHVCSRYLTANKDSFPNIEHRLYLDTESLDTVKMAILIVEKCDKLNLPFYFKYDDFGDRDDTLVIYSSTENLTKYIDVLRQIQKEHPELIARTNEPPILTGKIDGWIGYGSEPARTPEGKLQSFNQVRSKAIEKAINRVNNNWAYTNRNKPVTYQGRTVNFKSYVANKVVDSFISDLEKKFKIHEDYAIKRANSKGETYNQNEIINDLGYSISNIKHPNFRQVLFDYIDKQMGTILESICLSESGTISPIKMNVRNGKQIVLHPSKFKEILQESAVQIMKIDPTYATSVRTEIINESRKFGIDDTKYCFDVRVREKMRKASNQSYNPYQQVNNANVDMSKLDIYNITKIIDPVLLNRKLRLPNGLELPAETYIQRVVFQHLPKNGFFIMTDGTFMSLKTFIEVGVFGECQTKYNGNFPKYMAEKTRGNIGVISIDTMNGKQDISPEQIVDYINPVLLEGKVTLSNGMVMTTKSFITDVFAPHIPANGRVTLSTGVELSAIQFIEELLITVIKKNRYVDINEILYSSKKNNTGVINSEINHVKNSLTNLKTQFADFIQPNVGSGPKM